MTNLSKNDYQFDTPILISTILKYKKPLLIIVIITIVLSTIFSLLIEKKYKSKVTLFPASSSSISQSLLTSKTTKNEILKFGEEEEVEQMLQVLKSYEIRDKIINLHDLFNHYEIDPNKKYSKTKLVNQYDKNVSIKQTQYMSVDIEVLDKDAIKAAQIANDITALYDSTMNRMKRERAIKALNLVEKEYYALKDHVTSLSDSLKSISEKGVYDYESQSEVLYSAYAIAISENKIKEAKLLEEKLNILAKYGGAYISIRDLMEYETEKLSILESKYVESQVDLNQTLPNKYIVNKAYPAEKASYPIVLLIVIISTISSFTLSLLILLFRSNKK